MNHHSDETSQIVSAHIILLKDVVRLTSLSRSTILRMIDREEFPQPIALSTRRCGFFVHEVNDWISNRPRAGKSSVASEFQGDF